MGPLAAYATAVKGSYVVLSIASGKDNRRSWDHPQGRRYRKTSLPPPSLGVRSAKTTLRQRSPGGSAGMRMPPSRGW